MSKKSIDWYGNLNDDCSAKWSGLSLRAEWMDEEYWWWAVYDLTKDELEIDSSNNYEWPCIGGESARSRAELAAIAYINETQIE